MSKRKKRKKNRNRGPRRKRMRRRARLMAAVTWRSQYGGKNIVRSYARWFGVDRLCAIIELRMLGHEVPAEYEQQVRLANAARAAANARRKAKKLAAQTAPFVIDWWDEWPASMGLEEWMSIDEYEIDAASLGLEWIPTDEEAAVLAVLGSEWMSIDEYEADAASRELEWIPTDEEAAVLAVLGWEWIPNDNENVDLASSGPEWISTGEQDAASRLAEWTLNDEVYAALASIGPDEWTPTDEEDVALEVIGPVEWLLPDEEYAALPWIRPSEWTPTDEDYVALPPIRPQWIPTAEEVATLASIGRSRGSRRTRATPPGRRRGKWLPTDEGEASLDELPF